MSRPPPAPMASEACIRGSSRYTPRRLVRLLGRHGRRSQGCPETTVKPGERSSCTKTLVKGIYHLGVHTWKGSEYLGFTATGSYRYGFG